MKLYNYAIVIAAAVMVMSFASPTLAQDEEKAAAPAVEAAAPAPATAPAPVPAPEASQAKETAIYGEVQSVDAAAGTLAIQYYDYDSDSEKTAAITVTKDTKIENAGSLNDIKKGDWADVTYAFTGDSNVAKLVTVEKEEVAATEPAAPAAAAESADE